MTMLEQILAGSTSLVASLRLAAAGHPERGMTLMDRRGRELGRRTWCELLDAAALQGGRMAAYGVKPGDRVLVALPTCWEWFENWFGALSAGALPVAMAPPAGVGSGGLPRRRLEAVIDKLAPALLIGQPALVSEMAQEMATDMGPEADTDASASKRGAGVRPRVLAPETLAAVTPVALDVPVAQPHETAFLQLTSGSTGVPRAVEISHRAATHNALAIDEGVGAPMGGPSHEHVNGWASWLPLHHDMGLNSMLSMMLTGLDLWLCPSQAFLGRPRVWLENLARHGNTVATAPNFGYQLCVERLDIQDVAGLDLSNWKVALSGAEMVRADTLEAFAEKFAPLGFRREAFRPCYGLAEATVAVTIDQRGLGPRTLPLPTGAGGGLGLSEVVSVGAPVMDTELAIRRPDGSDAVDGEVGEVCIRGPGVFHGYWRDPEASAAALQDGWLRSGDLGFLDQGELFIAGRTKDVLIIRGSNVMPHELEWLAESVTGGGGAARAGAISIASGTGGEEVVLVLEVDERDAAVRDEIKDKVAVRIGRETGLPLADVMLVRRGRIPRTTSGKIRRDELRRLYVAQDLERLES